jgi:hypothetical protein
MSYKVPRCDNLSCKKPPPRFLVYVPHMLTEQNAWDISEDETLTSAGVSFSEMAHVIVLGSYRVSWGKKIK